MDLPGFFIDMLNKQYNEETVKKIINGLGLSRATTLRVNSLKSSFDKVQKALLDANISFKNVPFYNDALILENDENIQNLDIFKNGEIYLQSLSSMLPALILEPQENTDILDMAAAPGGKTTQLAALTHNSSNITACELNSIRAERLKFNIEKQGATCVYVMVSDSRKIDDFFSFDSILLDSPCSGSGTLVIGDENYKKYFTEKLIKKSVSAQLSLIQKASKILKTGHEMVYSTCSILECENEKIVNSILKNNKFEIVPINFEGMEFIPTLPTKIPGTLCVCPNELFEGFFVAKIRKK